MVSEAEIERLYQLFVANGGGSLTFDGTNLTPKLYSEAIAASNLTPLEMAQLEARQQQYNRQKALNSIANEIEANNFTNPYAARGAYGNSLFSALGSSSGATQVGLLSSALSAKNFSTAETAALFAGVMAASGIDLEKILKIAGLMALGTGMYTSLTNHTNNQTANIPGTMQDASSLASMNEQFGEQGDPCSAFNQLMGLLAGIYDGTLDFIDQAIGDITALLNDSGLTSLFQSIVAAVVGAGSVVADIISAIVGVGLAAFKTVLGILIPIVSKVINAVSDITSAIANEIAALADMAAELLRKALALVLGGAAADPCKRKVLENTGTPAMKEAVEQINKPLYSNPHMVGTTTDNRANAEEVTEEIKYARAFAALNSGVNQTFNTDVVETNENESLAKSSTTVHTQIYGYSPQKSEVDAQKGLSNNSAVSRNKAKIQATSQRIDQIIDRGNIVDASTPYIYENIRVVRDGVTYVGYPPITAPVYKEAQKKWIPLIKDYKILQGTLLSDLREKIDDGNFTGKDKIKDLVIAMHKNLLLMDRGVTRLLTMRLNPNFQYYTDDGTVDKSKEAEIRDKWYATGEKEVQNQYDRAILNLTDTKNSWASIETQVFNNPK
jgi:hypothetical protein